MPSALAGALFLLATTGARASGDRASWELMHKALLAQSADGDVHGALRAYERLVRTLPSDDPIYPDALYWLARSRYRIGEVRGAREALLDGIRTGSCRVRCYDLLGRIELEQYSIRSVPTRWTFDSADHGFLHPWNYDDKGSIRIGTPPGASDPALIWSTVVTVRKGDRLVVGFHDPRPSPTRVRFRARTTSLDAYLRILVEDDLGREYTSLSGSVRVPRGREVTVEVQLDELVALDESHATLDPSRLARLMLLEVTAQDGGRTGSNELVIDDFEVR